MLGAVLVFLRAAVDEHLRAADQSQSHIKLVEGTNTGLVQFASDTLSLLLVNIEAETSMRAADPFRRTLADGTRMPIAPKLDLNLHVLIVAPTLNYVESLSKLSAVIDYFQGKPLFTRADSPTLHASIERLSIELVSQSLLEQSRVWGVLRTQYQPSVLYRVKLIRFESADQLPGPEITDVQTVVHQR